MNDKIFNRKEGDFPRTSSGFGGLSWRSVSGDPNRSSKNEFHLRLPGKQFSVADHHTYFSFSEFLCLSQFLHFINKTIGVVIMFQGRSSRPFFKAVDKVLEQTLRATEMMVALVLGGCRRAQCEKFAMGCSYKLTAARRNLAPFQHHDEVTGTAKDHVVMDYRNRTHTSLLDVRIFMSKPSGDALPNIDEGGQLLTSEGLLMQEVYFYPRTAWEKVPVSHSTRLYSGENIV
ncbi:hypothetical protein VNO77_02170 [Canavalia gladiata]|uniref:Glycoside hydrolase family 38 central domain-containing protein n=1 Tax=Canavalia gladiata TaxID=3824 RepID=A0AAN9MYX3_CANGL